MPDCLSSDVRLALLKIQLRQLAKRLRAHRPKPWKMQDWAEHKGESTIIHKVADELDNILTNTP